MAVWDASPPLPLSLPGAEKTKDFGRFSGRRPSHRSNQLHLHTPLRIASRVTQGSRQESRKGHKGSLKRQVTTQGTQRRGSRATSSHTVNGVDTCRTVRRRGAGKTHLAYVLKETATDNRACRVSCLSMRAFAVLFRRETGRRKEERKRGRKEERKKRRKERKRGREREKGRKEAWEEEEGRICLDKLLSKCWRLCKGRNDGATVGVTGRRGMRSVRL